MQAEPIESKYRLLLPTGDIVEVEPVILRYLKTLDILTTDMGIEPEGDDNLVPIPNSELTKGQLSFIIGFYRSYLRDDGVQAVEEEIQSGNKSWALLLSDNRALGRVARAADFLEASEFLVFILPRLFSNVRSLSIEELESQLQQAKKRKEPFDESVIEELDAETRIVRLHYKHEVLVGQLLETLLPYQLVPGIDRRIRKYADPLSMSSYTTVIQYDGGEILFVVDYDATRDDEDYTLIVSVAAIDEALASPLIKSVNEIVSGDTFLAFTTEQGIVHLYGTHNDLTKALVDLKPFGSEKCLALWTFDTTVIVLTHETLGILVKDGEQGLAARLTDNVAASSVIEFSRGGKHLLVLTREGLQGYGASEDYQMGFSGNTAQAFVAIDVAGEEIEQAFAKGDHSIVLTKSGVLYATGDNAYGQLGGGYSEGEEDDMLTGWHLMSMGDLTAEIIRQKVRFITGDESRTVFVTHANRLYFVGVADHDLDSPYAEAEELHGFEGEIISVASRASEYLLLATTSGVYCFIDDDHFESSGLGTSSSTHSPYKLDIPFTGAQRKVTTLPNKKQKLYTTGLSCCACFAKPLFANTSRDKLFCSRFCFHKTQTA